MSQPRLLRRVVATVLWAAIALPLPVSGLVQAEEGQAPLTATDPKFAPAEQVDAQLAEGVRLYRIGDYKAAAAAFLAAIKSNPENQQLYRFYLDAGAALMGEMEQRKELEDVLGQLRRMAWVYRNELLQDPAYIDHFIAKLASGAEEERTVATRELVAIGPIAVPRLVARIGDTRQDDMRTYCRIVLTLMAHRAVVPLIETLKSSDARLASTAAMVLADIRDLRALPRLKLLADTGGSDTLKQVCANAAAAIAQANGLKEVPTADVLAIGEAQRYLRGNDIVRDEMVHGESLMWRWDDQATGEKLSYQRVPRYAWNELMAEQILFDAAVAFPANPAWHPLLAVAFAGQHAEARDRAIAAPERTTPARFPDEAVEAIQARNTALDASGSGILYRARMVGAANIYRGISAAVACGRSDAAIELMRLMAGDRGLAQPDAMLPPAGTEKDAARPGSVLVDLMGRPDVDKTVRYQAAMTLAALDPAAKHAGADLVVPLLNEAAGEWGMRVVLVVDQDYRQRNSARALLQQKGYLVVTAEDGFAAMKSLDEAPTKDAIILPGELLPTVRDRHGQVINVPEQRVETLIEALKADRRTAGLPIFVSNSENPELAAKIQGALADKGVQFLKKPFDAVAMADAIDAALKSAPVPNANRDAAEAVSLAACKALALPDPARTQYQLAAAADTLLKNLESRQESIRIASAEALGRIAQQGDGAVVRGMVDKVCAIYAAQTATDLDKSPALRAALVACIGWLNPAADAALPILAEAQKHADAGVRQAAFTAIGRAVELKPDILLKLQQGQRLDVRAPGAAAAAGAN
jgi:CheY-like chemotaxis protein